MARPARRPYQVAAAMGEAAASADWKWFLTTSTASRPSAPTSSSCRGRTSRHAASVAGSCGANLSSPRRRRRATRIAIHSTVASPSVTGASPAARLHRPRRGRRLHLRGRTVAQGAPATRTAAARPGRQRRFAAAPPGVPFATAPFASFSPTASSSTSSRTTRCRSSGARPRHGRNVHATGARAALRADRKMIARGQRPLEGRASALCWPTSAQSGVSDDAVRRRHRGRWLGADLPP